MTHEAEYRVNMVKMLERYGERLRAARFEDVNLTDASNWYRAEARREYQLIKADLYETLIGLLGQDRS